MTSFLRVALCLCFLSPLAGCGIKGDLKTPPPIWGEEKAVPAEEPASEPETETGSAPSELR